MKDFLKMEKCHYWVKKIQLLLNQLIYLMTLKFMIYFVIWIKTMMDQ